MNLDQARASLKSEVLGEVLAGLNILKDKGTLSDLSEIMPLTKHAKQMIQKTAAFTLCNIIREKLVSNFNDVTPELREKLGILMGSLNPSIVLELSKDIYSEESDRRLRAVQTLGLLKNNPQIRTLLAKLVADKDVKIKATAVNLLGKVIGPNDQELILSLLNDKDKRVRANTVEALESLGNKRMVIILQRFRKDPNNRIRGNVLKALYVLDNIDIESDIFEMFETKNDFMIATALWVITQTGVISKRLVDSSGHSLLTDSEMVLTNARKALTKLTVPRAKGYLTYLSDIHT